MVPSTNRTRRFELVVCVLTLCALSVRYATADEPALNRGAQPGEAATVQSPSHEGIANLPFARGRTFRTLDEYLAHLEKQGAIDLPWWREIRPGVYERVTSMRGGAEREVATREELMRRFGFTR